MAKLGNLTRLQLIAAAAAAAVLLRSSGPHQTVRLRRAKSAELIIPSISCPPRRCCALCSGSSECSVSTTIGWCCSSQLPALGIPTLQSSIIYHHPILAWSSASTASSVLSPPNPHRVTLPCCASQTLPAPGHEPWVGFFFSFSDFGSGACQRFNVRYDDMTSAQ